MGANQRPWLDIAEYICLSLTLLSLLMAIAFNQFIYPIVFLTIALILNVINRLRFQHHHKKRLSGAIKQVQRQFSEEIEDLAGKVTNPSSGEKSSEIGNKSDNSLFQENLLTLEQSINTIIQYLNNHAIRERIEQLEMAYNQLRAEIIRLASEDEDPPPVTPDGYVSSSNPLPSLSLPQVATIPTAPNWICMHTLTDHSDAVSSLALSPDGRLLASASWDQSLKVWEVATGELLVNISAHSQGLLSVVFAGYTPPNYTLVTGSFDQKIKVWSLVEQQSWQIFLNHTLTAHTGSVHALTCTADYGLLVSGSYDQTIKQWNLDTKTLLASSLDSLGAICALDINTEQQLIAGAGGDGKVTLWQIGSGQKLGGLGGNLSSVESLAISPDGQILAAGCVDGSIKLWQLEAGLFREKKPPQPIRILAAHRGQVNALVFSADGQLLLSSGADGLIKIWHPSNKQAIGVLNLTDQFSYHANAVFSLALSADSQVLVAGGMDGTIKIWQREN